VQVTPRRFESLGALIAAIMTSGHSPGKKAHA
jgi:hypothetical protein